MIIELCKTLGEKQMKSYMAHILEYELWMYRYFSESLIYSSLNLVFSPLYPQALIAFNSVFFSPFCI